MNSCIEIKVSDCENYTLLDSGNGTKLEEFGAIRVIRPEPKAWWKRDLAEGEWKRADACFDPKTGIWKIRTGIPKIWSLSIMNMIFEARLNENSKHVGIFPEQSPHWNYILGKKGFANGKKLLNLFAYTGISSMAALSAGFSVTHVDASSPSVSWAKRNLALSGMNSKPVRWILDDVKKFVQREIRRNSRYDAVILDPPAFGRGPKGELWKLEASIWELLCELRNILSEKPLFVILTVYNMDASSVMLSNIMKDVFPKYGLVSFGELGLKHKLSDKILPLSIYAKWENSQK
jgi:23S rRNA (cytosine1962-C5)-methyltransferase